MFFGLQEKTPSSLLDGESDWWLEKSLKKLSFTLPTRRLSIKSGISGEDSKTRRKIL
jgi:hypothetical protein